MAQTTPNFGFNIAEGTDTVNLLTQCYPNFSSLDSILQAIKETGVTTAVATKTGTNFAVVRTDTDCNFFRFIATANYVAGDTFTVDGVPVTATSAAGTALPSGAFVINQSVIAILNSSVLTVLVGGLSSADAADVDYDNTGSGLTATDVQAAIDEIVTTEGDLTALTTTDKTSLVNAINEVNASIVPAGSSISTLWTNPDVTVARAAGYEIELSSSDYDALIFNFIYLKGYDNTSVSLVVPKGKSLAANAYDLSSNYALFGYRGVSYTSDTKYTLGDGRRQKANEANYVTLNDILIPQVVYGIKF